MTHRNTRIIATVAGVLCLASVGACLGFGYMLSVHRATLATRMMDAATARAHQESLAKLVEIVSKTEAERAILKKRILGSGDAIEFLSLIETLGTEQNVTLTKNLTVEPINETFETLKMTINMSGSYDDVIRIVSLFETLPYQSVVSRVQIASKEEKGNGTGVWEGSLELLVTKYKKL